MAVTEVPDSRHTSRVESGRDRWFVALASVCVASIFVLLWLGREQWFFSDEWAFLVDRELSRPGTVLAGHNGHWVTLPSLLYRINYHLFGVRSYLPYQVPVVIAHLAAVLLVYATSRRIGVRPWIAALVSSAFIFFGAGSENVLWGFQVTLTGSVLCGLAHLLLANHDGPTRVRDALGLAVGAIGIMCSAVGVAMTIGVGAAVLVRRGRAAALLHTVPLAALYGTWFLAYGRDASRSTSIEPDVLAFVIEMAGSALEALGRWVVVAVFFASVAALGSGAAAWRARRQRRTESLSLVVGLVVAFVSFATLTGVARIRLFGVESAASERYLHVAAALVLPLVAAGAEVLAEHRRVAGAAPIVLLAIGVPSNFDRLVHREPIMLGDRKSVVIVAHSELLAQVPDDVRFPASSLFSRLGPTASWLREAVAQGRMPGPDGTSRSERLMGDLVVALRRGADPVGAAECPPIAGAVRHEVLRGDVIRFSGTIQVAAVRDDDRSGYVTFQSESAATIDVIAGPLTIEIKGSGEAGSRLCGITRGGTSPD